MVHGDSLRSHLIALAVLDPATAAPFVSRVIGKNVSASDVGKLQELVKDKRVRKAVVAALAKAGKERGLNGSVGLWAMRCALWLMLLAGLR